MDKILFTLHVMWYEYKMVNEMLDTLKAAIEESPLDVDIIICLNGQTYIEDPVPGVDQNELFGEFLNHPVLENATVIFKTMDKPFYNIGDWRRDIYGDKYDYKYIVWGESDCLIPYDYFYLLSNITITEPHFVSLANRQMWDDTWHCVEHPYIREWESENGDIMIKEPFSCGHIITADDLNNFNSKYDPEYVKLQRLKIDGNMTALGRNLPYPFLPDDLHFAREDYCMQQFFQMHNVTQYLVHTRLKGHNRMHPNKRLLTDNTRDDKVFKKYEGQAYESIIRFLNKVKYERINNR